MPAILTLRTYLSLPRRHIMDMVVLRNRPLTLLYRHKSLLH